MSIAGKGLDELAWFCGSRVVDAAGNPLMVFHGTLFAEFDEFDISAENAYEGGAFFSTSHAVASHFADPDVRGLDHDDEDLQPGVIPVYLSIKNPKRLGPEDVFRANNSHSFDVMRKALAKAKLEGYDGAHIVGIADGDKTADQWVAFHPDQIRSAIAHPMPAVRHAQPRPRTRRHP
ncbi:ADP-ribosyltransferase-containing protein [Paucibacter soli]|uniref:ADP-ribosyltransferase-containing protein n=1 Tax=Paucibacter soli TaxID=3133433 RepID=UPI0030A2802F